MPRIPRGQRGGYAYHVINRGNSRATVFHKPRDYDAFVSLLAEAKERHRVKLFAFCLMPNHFHFVIEPEDPTGLSRFMLWLLTTHMRRYHQSTTVAALTFGKDGLKLFRCSEMNI